MSKLRPAVSLSMVAVLGLLATSARAQVTPAAGRTPPDDTPTVRVGGVVWADYTYTDEPLIEDADKNRVHLSSFNVGRAYINVTGNISHLISFRITPDIVRETGTGSSIAGSLTFRLKYGYGQLNLDDWMTRGSWVRLGMQQTPWVDYMETLWRYRFQGTIFEDREGFLSSSDFAISGRYFFPGNYGDVHLGIYNGDTYTRAEPNDQKAFQVRASFRPFPLGGDFKGLRLTGFYDGDNYVKNGPRKRLIGNVVFEHKLFNASFNYLDAKDRTSVTRPQVHATGWSAWITPKFVQVAESKSGFEGILRFDNLKPNEDVDAHKKRVIAGLAYWFPVLRGPTATVLLDMERVTYDRLLARPDERRYSLHTQFTF